MTQTAPVIFCRCCLAPTDVRFQPGYAHRVGHHILTCRTAGCALRGYTLSAPDYATLDLSLYRASEHPDYAIAARQATERREIEGRN